jgi:hypothetical protein
MRFHDVWQGNALAQESAAASPGVTGLRLCQPKRQIMGWHQWLMF